MEVFLNDDKVPNTDIAGLDTLSITVQDVDSEGRAARSFSTDITFLGATYEALRQLIILGTGQNLGELYVANIKFLLTENDCCPDYLVFEGEIRGNSSVWCEGTCSIKVTVFEKKTEYDCVQSTMIWESNKVIKNATPTQFTSKHHPRFHWCDDPGNNQLYLRFSMCFGFTEFLAINIITVASLQVVVNSIRFLINTVKAIISIVGGTDPPDLVGDLFKTDWIDTLKNFIVQVEKYCTGCGNYHPAPLMRDYANNVCDICGLKFSSSILNETTSPYYDSVYLAECQTTGTDEGDDIEYVPGSTVGVVEYWVDDDRPLLTGDKYFNKLMGLHNSKWAIKPIYDPVTNLFVPTLIYEREDAFDNNEIWIDFSEIETKKIISQCYSFSQADVPAFGNFRFTKDGIDTAGDKRLGPLYSDIIEWNSPVSALQRGSLDITPPFGAVAVRGDDIRRDPRSDIFLRLGINGALNAEAEKALLIAIGQTSVPKAMIWNLESAEEARVRDYFSGGEGGALADAKGKSHVYNAPYLFEDIGYTPAQYANGKLQMTVEGNLYHNFWQIRNPRLQLLKRREYEIVFEYNCAQLKSLNTSHNVILVYQGMPKQGNITSVKVDFGEKRLMTVKGFI